MKNAVIYDREKLIDTLRSKGADQIPHVRGNLLEHLIRVSDEVKRYVPDQIELSIFGLFHSVYGTEYLKHRLWGQEQREELRQLLGLRVERWVWIFAAMDRRHFVNSLAFGKVFPAVTRGEVFLSALDEKDVSTLATILIINEKDHWQNSHSSYTRQVLWAYLQAKRWLPNNLYQDLWELAREVGP